MAIKLIVDSGSDFSRSEAEALGMKYVSLRTTFGSEEYLDGDEIAPHEFYEKLVETDVMPSTSQVPPYDFERRFDEVAANGDTALVVTMSSKLSGTYQSAVIAAEKYPDTIRIVDSLSVSVGERVLVRHALELIRKGLGLDAAVSALERARERVCVLALPSTLEYLKRGGRISASAAFLGGVLAIRPVLTMKNGEIAVIGKARGSKNANNLLSQIIERRGIDFTMPYLAGYTGLSDALLRKYIDDNGRLWRQHLRKVETCTIGSAIGTHAGPGAIAVAFFGA